MIEELISLAREIREAVNRGEEFGLSDEELAFYDALAPPAWLGAREGPVAIRVRGQSPETTKATGGAVAL